MSESETDQDAGSIPAASTDSTDVTLTAQ